MHGTMKLTDGHAVLQLRPGHAMGEPTAPARVPSPSSGSGHFRATLPDAGAPDSAIARKALASRKAPVLASPISERPKPRRFAWLKSLFAARPHTGGRRRWMGLTH